MWIVLCSATDHSALWMLERLQSRGRAPVALVLVESLADVRIRWDHRVGVGGSSLRVTLPDGREVAGGRVQAVLNRLVAVPLTVVGAAQPEDRDYATNELTAFAASWLRVLAPRMVNRPAPHGFAGRWRQPLEWRVLARRAGMPSAALRLSSEEPIDATSLLDQAASTVLTIDGHLLHPLAPPSLRRASRRFSVLTDTRVLGLRFEGRDPAAGGWRLLDATPYPDLSLGGEDGVAALEAVLAG